jgi:flagellar protein FliS
MQVETASPVQLVIMTYDGALKMVKQAVTAMERGDRGQAHHSLIQAQATVQALQEALDSSAGEVSAQLYRLYDYIHDLLVQANIKKDPSPLGVVVDILETLRSAWLESSRVPAPARPALAPGAWR